MARTRAERRHNTWVKTRARKRYLLENAYEWDQLDHYGLEYTGTRHWENSPAGRYVGLCWNNITMGGERQTCQLCRGLDLYYNKPGGVYDPQDNRFYAIRHGFDLDEIDIFDFT